MNRQRDNRERSDHPSLSRSLTPSLPPARILGIETSCDETAAAVVENGRVIYANVVASQAELHAKYGGVFPEMASRQHILTIYTIVQEALKSAHLKLSDVDLVAVTRGPGLAGSLVVGINMAKGLALGNDLSLIGVNHLEGHIYSAWLHAAGETVLQEPGFPLLALIASGGHTELVLMTGHLRYQHLGSTLDDAAGEAFDKIARLLGIGYPGGPAIQQAAKEGNPLAFRFPRAWLEGTWNFSFSGLKTAVVREVRNLETRENTIPVADLAASFQEAVVEVLVTKTLRAAEAYKAKEILVAGGVSANASLRNAIKTRSPLPVHIPRISLCTDNAAMIAGAGYYRFASGQCDSLDFDALPNWPLSELK